MPERAQAMTPRLLDGSALGEPMMILAWLVAMLAAFVSLELLGLAARARRRMEALWRLGAAVALATGIWSVHVIGLSAEPLPFAITFKPWGTLAAWGFGVVVSLAGVSWATSRVLSTGTTLVGSAVLALGVVAVQVAALMTLGLHPAPEWRLHGLAVSLVLVWLGAAGAFGLRNVRARIAPHWKWLRHGGAALLLGGSLVLAQHVVTVAAGLPTRSAPVIEALAVELPDARRISSLVLALLATVGSVALLLAMLLWSWLDARVQSALRQAEQGALPGQALRDPLTRLPNRPMFEGTLAQATRRADAASGRLALLFIGVNGLKQVHESSGRHRSEQRLRTVTVRLRALALPHMVARVGADEFALLLTGPAGGPEGVALAHKVREALGRPMDMDDGDAGVSCSIGIALYPEHGTASTVLAHAEAALRECERTGGATHFLFEARLVADAVGPAAPAAALRWRSAAQA